VFSAREVQVARHNEAADELWEKAEEAKPTDVKAAIRACLHIRKDCCIAADESVVKAGVLLAEYRGERGDREEAPPLPQGGGGPGVARSYPGFVDPFPHGGEDVPMPKSRPPYPPEYRDRILWLWLVLAALTAGCSPSTTEEAPMSTPKPVGPIFCNYGGPLLVLSHHLLPVWRGAPLDDVVGGDYGRAIEAGGIVSRVSVASEGGVVLGNDDHVMTAQWLRSGSTWMLVGWFYGDQDSDARLLEMLLAGRIETWTPLDPCPRVQGGLVLLHPASAGEEYRSGSAQVLEGTTVLTSSRQASHIVGIGDAIVARAPDGTYDMDWTEVEVEDEFDCILCRWTLRP
jgi:hypothetical protein